MISCLPRNWRSVINISFSGGRITFSILTLFGEQKKGADRGIDGELFFPNGPGREWGRLLTSVKGGENLTPDMVRAFAHVLDREKAEMGLFVCLRRPTPGMT